MEGKMPFSRHGDLKKGYGGSSSSSPEVVMEEGARNVEHTLKRIPNVTKRGSSIGDIRSLKHPAKPEAQ